MVKVDLGTKRACLACGMRFYDLSRSPIICPGCGAEFDPENIIKSRKNRPATKTISREDITVIDHDQIENDDVTNDLTDTVVDDDDDNDIDFDDNDSDNVDVDVDDDTPGIIQDDISDDDELLPNLDNKDENQSLLLGILLASSENKSKKPVQR